MFVDQEMIYETNPLKIIQSEIVRVAYQGSEFANPTVGQPFVPMPKQRDHQALARQFYKKNFTRENMYDVCLILG